LREALEGMLLSDKDYMDRRFQKTCELGAGRELLWNRVNWELC
jgi:hypothetical protein